MSSQPDFTKLLGWQGDPIPEQLMGIIVTQRFMVAVAVLAASFDRTYKDLQQLMQGVEPGEYTSRLSADPIFRATFDRLQWLHDNSEPADEAFRENAQELYARARTALVDAIIANAIAMWVTDGATIEPELWELAQMVEREELLEELDEEE